MSGSWFSSTGRLPVILQSELTECGLASLTMIAVHHGHDVDLAAMRRRFPISLRGASLARLLDVASRIGLSGRALRLEVDALDQVRTPCILHWNLNHFVVLKQVTRRHVHIHDPARGYRRLRRDEVGDHFTGIALELEPATTFKPMRERDGVPFRTLVGRMRGLARTGIEVLVLALALEALALTAPLQLRWILDRAIAGVDHDLVTLLGIAFLVVATLQALLGVARSWALGVLGASFAAQWTGNLFSHLLRLPLDYFEKRNLGDVQSRFLSVRTVQQTLTSSFAEAALDGLAASFAVVLLYVLDPSLAAIVAAAIGAYALTRRIAYGRLRALKEEHLVQAAHQQSLMFESVRAIQTVKIGGFERDRRNRFLNATNEVAHLEAAIARLEATFAGIGQFAFGAMRVAVAWIGARLVLAGHLSVGSLVMGVAYAELCATRVRALIDKASEFALLGLHAERIADIARCEPEQHVLGAYCGPEPAPGIEVDRLSFRYADDEPWVVHDCSFSIRAGESVAIVGPSGCGKSTLAKLILGLLEPSEGEVRFGGIDIRRYGLSAYRAELAAVLQGDDLFAGSIAANISSFDPGADLPDIQRAAQLAGIAEDIGAMQMGYETRVGELGSCLSGGQKQRILLARALYRRPRILVLDEATSHLDVQRERHINAAVASLAVTRIIIAHRPETIASADRVIRLGEGHGQAEERPLVPASNDPPASDAPFRLPAQAGSGKRGG